MARLPNLTGTHPDLTAAQITAIVGWAVAQAVAFGWLRSEDQQLAVSVGATVLAAALKLADSHLRGKRAVAHAIASSGATPPAAL